MKPVSRFAMAVALVSMSMTSAVSAWAAEEKPKKEKGKKEKEEKPQAQYSKEFVAAYLPANDAFEKAKDYQKAKSLLPAMIPFAKSDDERLQAGRLTFLVALQLADVAMQKEGLDMALGSATIPAQTRAIFLFQRGILAVNAKNYAGAMPDLLAAYDGGYRESNVEFNIGNAYQQQGNTADALAWYKKAVEAAGAKKVLADKAIFSRGLNLSSKLKDVQQVAYWGREFIRAYPEPGTYRDAVVFLDAASTFDSQESLDIMRLARLNKGLVLEGDYRSFIEAADPIRNPAEAISVIKQGVEAKTIQGEIKPDGTIEVANLFFKEQLALATKADGELRVGWDQDEKTALAAPAAIQSALFGDTMLSYGEYARAQRLYEAALQKGAIVDKLGKDQTDRTRLRLAVVKAMQGNYADARADLAMIAEPKRKAIAEYWLVYVDQMEKKAAAPAA